jgi:purine-nucleoside phosphorylase
MRVFAMSVITDLGIRGRYNVITHQEVLEAARNAEPNLLLFLPTYKELKRLFKLHLF